MAAIVWLTAQEAADLLTERLGHTVSSGRVRQLIARKQLKSTLHGHLRLIRRTDLDRYEPQTGRSGGRPVGFRVKRPKGWTPPVPKPRIRRRAETMRELHKAAGTRGRLPKIRWPQRASPMQALARIEIPPAKDPDRAWSLERLQPQRRRR